MRAPEEVKYVENTGIVLDQIRQLPTSTPTRPCIQYLGPFYNTSLCGPNPEVGGWIVGSIGTLDKQRKARWRFSSDGITWTYSVSSAGRRKLLLAVPSWWTAYEPSTILNVPYPLVFKYFSHHGFAASSELLHRYQAYASDEFVVWTLIFFWTLP